jgi:hypothetical protein
MLHFHKLARVIGNVIFKVLNLPAIKTTYTCLFCIKTIGRMSAVVPL